MPGDNVITRHFSGQSFSLTDDISTTPKIDFGSFAGGMIRLPSASPITSLTFYAACDEARENFSPLDDKDGNPVTRTVAADHAYPLPTECFGALALKILVNSDGSADISRKG